MTLPHLSFPAIPQTFGPLVRDRAIRQQTSEEDLNANIESIYRKDFKATSSPSKAQQVDEVEPSPTELVARSQAGGSPRPRRPIDNNEQNAMVYVIRDAEGKLVPKFANPQPVSTTPSPTPKPALESTTDAERKFVLKLATPLSNKTEMEFDDPTFELDSYPEHYPFEKIRNILQNHADKYEEMFENRYKREPLSTRINSEADKYLCSSVAHTEYPTYDPKQDVHIVNVQGFYQPVVFETCSRPNVSCNKSVSTASNYELVCEQTYRDYKLFVYSPNDENKFVFMDIEYPACCKCAQVLSSSRQRT
uniref:Spaetzle domain-containing protein n=1 Tax=Anopheles stephensi TaxID=30069 RepID=A0A182YK13_ANOST